MYKNWIIPIERKYNIIINISIIYNKAPNKNLWLWKILRIPWVDIVRIQTPLQILLSLELSFVCCDVTTEVRIMDAAALIIVWEKRVRILKINCVYVVFPSNMFYFKWRFGFHYENHFTSSFILTLRNGAEIIKVFGRYLRHKRHCG